MTPEPKDPAQIRIDVDKVFNNAEHEQYKTFGELFAALMEAGGETLRGLYRQTQVSRESMRDWREDKLLPLRTNLETILEKNALHFRTGEDGAIDPAQRHAFLRAASLDMTPEEIREAVKGVIAREAEYPDFGKFMTALFTANSRITDDEVAAKLDLQRSYVESLRGGRKPASRDLVEKIVNAEANPFNLPAEGQEGKAVIDPQAVSLVWRKAGVEEIKPEERRQSALEKLRGGAYTHASQFFKDAVGHRPYDEIARRMREATPEGAEQEAVINRDRVSLLLNGHRGMTANEGNALLTVAQVPDNSPDEAHVKGLSYKRLNAGRQQAALLKEMTRDFVHSDFTFWDTSNVRNPRTDFPEVYKPPIGITPEEFYMRAKTMAPEGEEPFSKHTLSTLLLTSNAPQKPMIRVARYVAKVLDGGLPQERVDEWIKLNSYTREELFQTPQDIVAHMDRYPSIASVVKALRQTEEINYNGRVMAGIARIHPNAYAQHEQKYLTSETVEAFLETANATMAARKFKPLSDEERGKVMERAHAELDNRPRAEGGPAQDRYVSRNTTPARNRG